MRRRSLTISLSIIVAVLTSFLQPPLPTIAATVIDNFDIYQKISVEVDEENPLYSWKSDVGVLGGERDLYVQRTSGTEGEVISALCSSANSYYSHAQASGVKGWTAMVWDGADNDASDPDNPSLAYLDVDLEASGSDRLAVKILSADDAGAILKLTIYDTAGRTAAISQTIEKIDSASPQTMEYPYTSFTTDSGFSWNNVAAVKLVLDGTLSDDRDIRIDWVGFYGSPTAVEQLSLGGTGNTVQMLAGVTVVLVTAVVLPRTKTMHVKKNRTTAQ